MGRVVVVMMAMSVAAAAASAQQIVPTGPRADLGNSFVATVSGVRTWSEFDSVEPPPDGAGVTWKSGATVMEDFTYGASPMIGGTTKITIGADTFGMAVRNFAGGMEDVPVPPANGVYQELTVWFANTGKKAASLDVVAPAGPSLDAALILPDKSRLSPVGFRFPHMSHLGVFEGCFATTWTGKLAANLGPGAKTWVVLLFDVPTSAKEARLQIKKAAPVKIKLAQP